jgi:hypothetical protein
VTLWLHDEEGVVKQVQPENEFTQAVTHVQVVQINENSTKNKNVVFVLIFTAE